MLFQCAFSVRLGAWKRRLYLCCRRPYPSEESEALPKMKIHDALLTGDVAAH